MMHRIFVLLIAICSCLLSHADDFSPDTIPLAEMKQLFVDYLNGKEALPLDSFDWAVVVKPSGTRYGRMARTKDWHAMRNAYYSCLPADRKGWEWSMRNANDTMRSLLLPERKVAENISGNFRIMYSPFKYGPMWATKTMECFTTQEGVNTKQQTLAFKDGDFEKKAVKELGKRAYPSVAFLKKQNRAIFNYLEEYVNDRWERSVPDSIIFFAFVLHNNGKTSDLELVQPLHLSIEGRALFLRLRSIIRTLPVKEFSRYFTGGGNALAGRFIMARYCSEGWNFRDTYRLTTEEEEAMRTIYANNGFRTWQKKGATGSKRSR